MGLDSVELLMDFENYFKILIENTEAENICTIQQMVDCVCKHRGISGTDAQHRKLLFEKICLILSDMQPTSVPLHKTDFIFSILHPADAYSWNKFEKALTYIIPKPRLQHTNFLHKASRLFLMHPDYNYKDITVERFIDVICAVNYKLLIVPQEIKNSFEVYMAIAGITAEKLGIDPYEISPEKAFVKDLGLS